jgi:hypothetical protein
MTPAQTPFLIGVLAAAIAALRAIAFYRQHPNG